MHINYPFDVHINTCIHIDISDQYAPFEAKDSTYICDSFSKHFTVISGHISYGKLQVGCFQVYRTIP